MESISVAAALHILEHQTGIVIPVHFRPDDEAAAVLPILRDTVHMFVREVHAPHSICLSVDGPGPGETFARQMVAEYGVRIQVSPQNQGKLAAVANGMIALLDDPALRYFAAVDQDGDHFANELLNFIRAAEHAAASAGTTRIMVLGNRLSRHRPLGFLRAEQEELANWMLLDALAYDAALTRTPLNLQFFTVHEPLPDFHSGYKCFSRAVAADVFTKTPDFAGCSDDAYYRHACEAVMTVESHKAGAVLAAVNRRTFDDQPFSLFASLNRIRLAADMIVWPCRRLGVPGEFVAQWLANHIPSLLLGTLVPQGRDELLAIQRAVLEAYGLDRAPSGDGSMQRPRFL